MGTTGVAVAFGLAIMVMVYALGPISGAHFNPAVTLAFTVGRHFPAARLLPYWAAQVAGAVTAAAVLRLTLGMDAPLGVTQPAGSDLQAFAWEVVLTFMLMVVIAATATGPAAIGEHAAIAIGATVALDALVGGPISGASMNPARSLGPALVSGHLDGLWIYLGAPVLGALIAMTLSASLARLVETEGARRQLDEPARGDIEEPGVGCGHRGDLVGGHGHDEDPG